MSDIDATLHTLKEHARLRGDVKMLSQLAGMNRYHQQDTQISRNAARRKALRAFGIPKELVRRVQAFALRLVRDCDRVLVHSEQANEHDLDVYAAYMIDHVYMGCFGSIDYEKGFEMATRLRALITHPTPWGKHGHVLRVSTWKDLHPRIMYELAGKNPNCIKYANALLGVMTINFVLEKILASGLHYNDNANVTNPAYAKVHRATALDRVARAGYALGLMNFTISHDVAAAMTEIVTGIGEEMALSLAERGHNGEMTLINALDVHAHADRNIKKASAIARKKSVLPEPNDMNRRFRTGMSFFHQLMRIYYGPLRAMFNGGGP